MKAFKAASILALCAIFLFSSTSCVVLVKRDNGNHKGWFKNPNNPHNPGHLNTSKNKGNNQR